jgi:hypothetical protein
MPQRVCRRVIMFVADDQSGMSVHANVFGDSSQRLVLSRQRSGRRMTTLTAPASVALPKSPALAPLNK